MKVGEIFVSGGVQAPTEMRCGASFCYRGNAEGVFEVTLTNFGKKCVNMSNIKYDLFKYFVYYEVVEFTE